MLMLNLMFFLSVFIFIVNIIFGFFVIWRKKVLENVIFGLFAISCSFWVLGISLAVNFPKYCLFFGRLSFSSAIFGIGFIFIFSLIFLEDDKKKKRRAVYFLFPTLVLGLTAFTDLMIRDVFIKNGSMLGSFGPLMKMYNFYFPTYVLGAIAALFFKFMRIKSGFKKLQLKYVLSGVALFFIPATITNAVLPFWFGYRGLNTFGPLFSVCMICCIGYSVTRHKLMDINIIIQRSLIYSVLFGLVVSFYLVLLFILGEIFQKTTNTAILFSAGLTTVLGIFTVPAIERYFRKLTDRVFFKDKCDHTKSIHELSEILNINLGLEDVLSKITVKLKEIFKINKTMVVLRRQNLVYDNGLLREIVKDDNIKKIIDGLEADKKIITHDELPLLMKALPESDKKRREFLKQLEYYSGVYQLSLAAPIVLKNNVIGLLFLGNKLSGDRYAGEDLDFLKTFSSQLAVALEKARLYEAEKNYAHELERQVEERTKKIQKLQEEQKLMMLEISHGLQTPLTIIKGEAELLGRRAPGNESMSRFEKSIEQVSKFIYDMLKLARLETMEEDFKKSKIDLSELLNGLIEYFDVLIKEKNIKIKSNIDPEIFIMGQKSKLEEMIINLVSNSIKYIDNERNIFINLKKIGDKAELSIEDTGIGINRESLPYLFTKFYRVKDERHRNIKGTGLGLVIVKKIAEKHDATVFIESLEGVGTKIIISFEVIHK